LFVCLLLFSVFVLCGIGVELRALYLLGKPSTTLPTLFTLVYFDFQIGSHTFTQVSLRPRSSYLHLQSSLDYRYEPPCLADKLLLIVVGANRNWLFYQVP
jgi:hypothetical protein